jgi:RNA polymerase sigma-70 factor (ECF subfamily)
MAGEPSDERLMAQADGDPSAFAALYRRYERPLLAYFVRRTRDPELAADLTAEVFAAALAGLRRYRAADGSVHAWLFGIAEHKLVSSLRRRRVADEARRRLGMGSLELDDDDLDRIVRCADGATLTGLLEDLPADQREAVRARILDERGYGEIARELRCSQAVVRKRVSRGLATLRQQVSKGEA